MSCNMYRMGEMTLRAFFAWSPNDDPAEHRFRVYGADDRSREMTRVGIVDGRAPTEEQWSYLAVPPGSLLLLEMDGCEVWPVVVPGNGTVRDVLNAVHRGYARKVCREELPVNSRVAFDALERQDADVFDVSTDGGRHRDFEGIRCIGNAGGLAVYMVSMGS